MTTATKKPKAKTARPATAAEAARALEQATAWWAAAYAAVDQMASHAHRMHCEVTRPGSPFEGLFAPGRIADLAGSLTDLTCKFADCAPASALTPSPFDGFEKLVPAGGEETGDE